MHKSDIGGLALGLTDAAAVKAAHDRLMGIAAKVTPAPAIDGILVQEMITGGGEFILGMSRDPVFGPTVVFGPGGVFVDLFDGAVTRAVAPFGFDAAAAMIDDLPAARRLLDGFRGAAPGDRAALERLIADFAGFVAGLGPDVVAIDLNPVIVLPAGRGVRIVDAAIEFSPTRS
jgi:hypothetical protein